ncbi:MAG TPA: RHS repeat-associated core domain-containing protein [Archangium sp.]|uniref:RHS repeat-associated core domain-containing protein n=1 Tax=Archangium sp. TaxID=1872627 RepID=UPI002E3137AD|nr:RHS repeat-associated core domain-containing protein [Archangium sp.]HEX5745664.1 RHS repeat-associated core domain-containing protein [Archangium sp.]
MLKIHDTQLSTLRKHFLAESLARSFQSSSLSSSVESATGDVLVADPKGNQARYTLDGHGFVNGVTSPLGRRWRLENDSQGKLLALSDPKGLRLGLSYDSRGLLTSTSQGSHKLFDVGYDKQGLLNEIIYPDGTRRTYEYKTPQLISAVGNRLGAGVEYKYDSGGLLESIRDGNGHRTQFEYGRWSRPDRAIRADGSYESYVYNSRGLVERIFTGSELLAYIEYDDQDQPVVITYGGGERLSRVYEGGRLVETSTEGSTVKYVYDDKGHVLEEHQDDLVVRYDYDESGALTGLVYPSGERVEFALDADQRPSSIRLWTGDFYRFGYGADDRTIELSGPNDLTTVIRQSQLGLPVSVVTRRSNFATARDLFSYTCEYDAEARLRSCKDSAFGSRRFTYDSEGQILEVDSENPGLRERFAYDLAGNRVRWNEQRATFDSVNRLIQQGDTWCGYDARGNLVSLRSSAGEWIYRYNFRNLLVEAHGPGGQRVSYGYDALGRRIWKRTAAAEVRYVWAGETLIGEVERSGSRTITRDFLYIPGTYTPLAMRVDGRIYSYHTDHRGVPIRLTNEVGSVVWAADYSAYGQASVLVERISNPLRLPGQYHDEETGLQYNRFRYYSPLLGRYLTQDPTTYLNGLHFYSYASNDPINSADPQGLWSWSWSAVASIAASAVVGIAVTVAVGALLAPLALPALAVTAAAVVLGGAAAGAVGFGLNEALNQTDFCFLCILKAMGKGALVGAVASLPFVFLPAAAGALAFMGAGAASGAIGYIGDWLASPGAEWSWLGFSISVGLGAVTAGVGAKYMKWKQSRNAPREAPPAETPEPPVPQPEAPVGHSKGTTVRLDQVRYSQKTVNPEMRGSSGDKASISDVANDMRNNGWNTKSDPPDMVDWGDGQYQTLDHRRIMAAREAGLEEIPANIHAASDPLPPDVAQRFEFQKTFTDPVTGVKYNKGDLPTTWGEAAMGRAAKQGSSFPLRGSVEPPKLSGSGN